MKIEGTWNATGMRGTISHTIRYDCAVDPSNVVGRPGQYLTIDLQGFALLRGSEDQVSALRTDEEFQRRVTRADQIVESQGVVDAAIG